MTNDITTNAQAAAQTPANEAPAPVEDKRPYPVRFAEQQQREKDAVAAAKTAAMSPGQKELEVIRKSEAFWKGNHPEHQKVMERVRQLLAAEATPEEKETKARATTSERREEYGVEPPALPPVYAQEYERDYIGWEVPLYDVAGEHGLAAEQVRGLRDAAIDLGQVVGDTGRPASEADLVRIFDKYKVSLSARPALVALWKKIEGTAS